MKSTHRPIWAIGMVGVFSTLGCSERAPVEPPLQTGPGLDDGLPGVVEEAPNPQLQRLAAPAYNGCNGRIFPPIFDDLFDMSSIPDFLLQRLDKRDIAVSVAPPRITGKKDQPTLGLLNVLGTEKMPLLLVNSEVLVKSGRMRESAGTDFSTALFPFDEKELSSLDEHRASVTKAGDVAKQALVFEGRNPVGLSKAGESSIRAILDGKLVATPLAPVMPPSTEANWLESVLINSPKVVQDPNRTFDPCTGAGNPDGTWTFKHLMTEMANEPLTGITPEDFTLEFLLTWMFPRSVNDDHVSERPAMWTEVIEPWLVASGGEQLNLDLAPFRLLAIVNRLDLRKTGGGSGYFGSSGLPLDAGELRFVFGAVRPPRARGEVCEPMEFTTIFEYGVPIAGCSGVRDWAREWTKLNLYPAFETAYRNQLETLTERVVSRNAAPGKGNGSALNQLRTNEIALARPWEMNEFTLTEERDGDAPVDGMLRPHTVAQTPDDAVFSPTPNPVVSDFIDTVSCGINHEVPLEFAGKPFRGGNSLVGQTPGSPPGTWFGDPPAVLSDAYICSRHQFSLNTCNGCHSCDTGTSFTHISPTSGIPAALSGFLTGTSVEDTQFPADRTWTFADLDRRFVDLYQVADSLCFVIPPFRLEMARLVRERFPEPVLDIAKAIDILENVEREALQRFPVETKPDPAASVLAAGILRRDINAAH